MRFFPVLFVFLFSIRVQAQGERPAYKTMAQTFQQLYNRGQYDSLFLLFSDEMKKALPLDKTRPFFTNLKTGVGQMQAHQFVRTQAPYASYKATFERDTLSLNLALDAAFKIAGFYIQPYVSQAALARNSMKLALPFAGAWRVMWGGDTKEQNYHVEAEAQKGAFDFVVADASGKSYRTNGKTNADYYVFGKELLAPCDAEVVLAVDGVKDNVPGRTNPMFVTGNTVILKAAANEYILLAHFKQGSVRVKEGQKVAKGDVLGLCGNSGNSSEPHLHFHIQNIEDINSATGIKCYFETLTVNGKAATNYSPVKGDVIQQ